MDILSDQSQNCSDNWQFWSENVRCPTTILSTDSYVALILQQIYLSYLMNALQNHHNIM